MIMAMRRIGTPLRLDMMLKPDKLYPSLNLELLFQQDFRECMGKKKIMYNARNIR